MRRLPALLTAAALAATSLVATAAPAHAAEDCNLEPSDGVTLTGISPSKVVIGTEPKKVEFEPYWSSDSSCPLAGWRIEGGSVKATVNHTFKATVDWPMLDLTKVSFLRNRPAQLPDSDWNTDGYSAPLTDADAGTRQLSVYATNYWGPSGSFADSATFALTLLQATKADLGASATNVTEGSPIVLHGNVWRAQWSGDEGHWVRTGSDDADPVVQFKAKGTDAFYDVTRATPNPDAAWNVRLDTSRGDGYWRVRYPGDATTDSATSGSVYVDVVAKGAPTPPAKVAPKLTMDAGPEPMLQGQTMTVSGHLTRSGAPVRDATVYVQFGKPGHGYSTVTSTTTSETGAFTRGISTARGSGLWRVYYRGNATTTSRTSAADRVTVIKPKHYATCRALNNDWGHGVGRPGATDSTSGTPVANFRRSTLLYSMNNGPRNKATHEYDLDRDNDGIACEKR